MKYLPLFWWLFGTVLLLAGIFISKDFFQEGMLCYIMGEAVRIRMKVEE